MFVDGLSPVPVNVENSRNLINGIELIVCDPHFLCVPFDVLQQFDVARKNHSRQLELTVKF